MTVTENEKIIKGDNWSYIVTDKENLLTDETIEELKETSQTIFFNDLTGKHWVFDFKVNNVWFESTDINCVDKIAKLNAFK